MLNFFVFINSQNQLISASLYFTITGNTFSGEVLLMKIGYSVLREIDKKEFIPTGHDFGITDVEFENLIKLLENKGYIERVLRVGDKYYLSIKNARLTEKGLFFLEQHKHYEESYPHR